MSDQSQHDDETQSEDGEEPTGGPTDYSESGVDRTLIRWMLSLTPMERLMVVQDQLNAIEAMKEENDSSSSIPVLLEPPWTFNGRHDDET